MADTNPLHITVRPYNPTNGTNENSQELQVTNAPTETSKTSDEVVNGDWSNIQKALTEGYSKDEISAYLQQTQNLDKDTAELQVIDSVRAKIKSATSEGYTDEEVRDFLIQNNYDGALVDNAFKDLAPKKWKALDFDPNTTKENVMDIADLYHNLYDKYSNTAKSVAGVFDDSTALDARRDINNINFTIANKLKERGFETQIDPAGQLLYKADNGLMMPVDSSFLNGLYNSKAEAVGSIAGAIGGGVLGTAIMPGAGTAAGSFIGGGVGAAIGKGVDMLVNANRLKEELDTSLVLTQMAQAGIADGVFSVLGTGIIKAGGASLRKVVKAFELVRSGNAEGAYKALLDNMLIDEDQAEQLVQAWENLNDRVAPGKTMLDKAISVIATTQQGAEMLVGPAVNKNPKLANTLAKDINDRAKGLAKAVNDLGADGVGTNLRAGLDAYRKDVKEFYGVIKQQAGDAIDYTDFRFDYDALAVKPALDTIGSGITDPRIMERYVAYAQKIEGLSKTRTFSSLVDLRQTVNDFKHSSKSLSFTETEMLNKVLGRIDSQISKAVKTYMPDEAGPWLENFKLAKSEYAKMKQMEKNILYKALVKKGVSEESIKKAIKSSINSIDGTFDEVLTALPPAARARAEASAISILVDKYTVGKATDIQATHFPALAEAIGKLNLKSAESKKLKNVIDEYAKVFRNDVNLGRLSGKLDVPSIQTYLTNSPISRVEMEVANSSFRLIKRMLHTEQGRTLALLHRLPKLLENPLEAKTVDDFMRNIPKESQAEMRTLVQQLQIEWAKQPAKPKQDWVRMYKQSSKGSLVVTDGALGKGTYLFNKVKPTSADAKVISHEVNMSRMATLDDASRVMGKDIAVTDFRKNPDIARRLQEEGYLGISMGDKAMLFPDKAPVVTKPAKSVPVEDTSAIDDIIEQLKDDELNIHEAEDLAYRLGYTIKEERSDGGRGVMEYVYKKIKR